jgi:hypothetical protein
MELVGALLAVRLARKIINSLRMELESVRYFTDSSAVLGMLSKDSASFLEFVGIQVSEIRNKSDPDKEWFWIPGELNPRRTKGHDQRSCPRTWHQEHHTRMIFHG